MSTTPLPGSIAVERRVPPLGGFNLTLLRIELRRRLRNKRTVFFTVAFPVIMFLMVGAKYVNDPLDPGQPVGAGGTSLAAYAMISFAVYGAMLASTAAGGAVALERAQGWSRQLRITPLTPAANIAVKILGGLVLGLLAVLATFAAGVATGVRMPWQVWVLAGLTAWLGSLVFTALGLLVGYLVPSENVMQFMGPVLAFLAFFGGIFIPLSQLPELLQAVGVWTPTYGIGEIARAPLSGEAFNWLAVGNVLLWLVLFGAGAALAFRRDTKRV
ncbi:ABC transporter permease [Arthrobacter sp. YAF34]|uniref:ABC transporter permease n=1 Tax=Arthrobacter sp. YAF34 TaxID=3233083 RepID=UPI003F921024